MGQEYGFGGTGVEDFYTGGDTSPAGGSGDPYAFDPSTMDPGGGYDPGAEQYDYDTPDTDPTGGSLPGQSLVPFGGSVIPYSNAFLNQYNQYGVPRPPGFGSPPNLGVSPMPPGSPVFP